ncbi:FHA domain-containing protein [bacterium]|nr:FHA domain-containing protein [bacterium]
MGYALVSTDDLGRKVVFPLRKVMTLVGRDPGADIVLADDNVSRQHVKIYVVENRVEVKDMGSRNGTFLNNHRIDGMRELREGDELIIGSNQFYIHVLDDAEESAAQGMTAFRTIDQLRDPTQSFVAKKFDEAIPPAAGEQTVMATRGDLVAEALGKKLDLARYPSIEVLFGAGRGAKYLLPPGRYVLGRSTDCNIRIDDEKISQQHAEFIAGDAGVTVRDLDSRNGTLINNRAARSVRLRHKDTIVVGHTKLKFLDPASVAERARLNVEGSETWKEAGLRDEQRLSPTAVVGIFGAFVLVFMVLVWYFLL